MGPGGDRGWGRLTGVELRSSSGVRSLFGVVLSWEEPLLLVTGRVSSLFCKSSDSSSSPSPDTPEDEELDVCPCSVRVLWGATRSGVPLSALISPFSTESLSITSDAISQESPVARSQRRLQPNVQKAGRTELKRFSNLVQLRLKVLLSLTALSCKQKRQILHSIRMNPFSPKKCQERENQEVKRSVLSLHKQFFAGFLSASCFASSEAQYLSANSNPSGYI